MIDIGSIDPVPLDEALDRVENPDEFEGPVRKLLRPENQSRNPYRNPDVLEAVADEYKYPGKAGDAMGCGRKAVHRWLRVFGIQAEWEQTTPSSKLAQLNPEDLGLSPMGSRAGGAD